MVKSMNLAFSPFFGMKAGGKSFNGKVVAFFVKISALSKVFLKKNFLAPTRWPEGSYCFAAVSGADYLR